MAQIKLVIKKIELIFFVLLISIANQPILAGGDDSMEKTTDYYRVLDGKVDSATFVGWSVFHHACVGCHGVGGVGSEIAPDLTESIIQLSPEEFRIKVLHQYAIKFEQAMFEEIQKQELRDRGELATMPHWENNPIIKENVQNIYRYLKARSDGAIGPGKPKILKE
jgi:mono/diheme cytochrome c family protein